MRKRFITVLLALNLIYVPFVEFYIHILLLFRFINSQGSLFTGLTSHYVAPLKMKW